MNDNVSNLSTRIWLIVVFIICGCSALLTYHWSGLQIDQHRYFSELARDNQIKLLSVEPPRGNIFDRHGVQITNNRGQFALKMDSEFADEVLGKIDSLTTIIKINNRAIEKLRKAKKSQVYKGEVILRQQLSETEVQNFIQWQFLFPEVVLYADLVRQYPYEDAAGHVLGYVGRINQDNIDQLKKEKKINNYRAAKFIGKTGIELIYEDLLRGKSGSQEAEVDAHGRIYNSKIIIPPEAGKDIHLTLDWHLQMLAESLLADERGAVVLINVKTGELLALASNPRFDGNQFIFGISHDNWDVLNTSKDKPLIHRAIYGQYSPGSVIKPFLAISALNNEWRDVDYVYTSKGFFKLSDNHIFHDWKKGGHGEVNIEKSIVRSVNTFYYTLGNDVGIDAMHDALSIFGFGQHTKIDLNNEKAGILPSVNWKLKKYDQPWYPGDTISSSVGQGYMQMTPLQMARAMSVLANGGVLLQPYLLKQTLPSRPVNFKDEHVNIVQTALEKVTQQGGTAFTTVGKGAAYGIAGKTGTAQVSRLKFDEKGNRVKNKDLPKHLRDHAWFVGYAPVDKPQVAIAVIVENGGSGGKVAGPVARKMLDAYIGSKSNPNPSIQLSIYAEN